MIKTAKQLTKFVVDMKRTYRLKQYITLCLLAIANPAFAQEENMNTIADIHHLAAYMVATLLIAVFVMIFSNRLYNYRLRAANIDAQRQNTQLSLVLDNSKTQIWTYHPNREYFTLFLEHGEKRTSYSAINFSTFYDHNDFNKMLQVINDVKDRKLEKGALTMRGKKPTDGEKDSPQKIFDVNIAILKKNMDGELVILGIQKDITEEKQKEEYASNLALRYHTVFNSSLVDMIYYNAEGIMTDINEKACETFEVKDREALLASKPNINDVPALRDLDLKTMDQLHSSSITPIHEVEHPIGTLFKNYWGSRNTYYEQIVSPVHDQEGNLDGVVMAGINITEMVESQHHQKWASQQLAQKTKDIQAYIDNINYTLRVSKVQIVNYDPERHELEIYSDLNQLQYRLPQVRCLTLLRQYERRRAKGLIRRMDLCHPKNFSARFETIFRDTERRNIFLTFNMVPVTEKDGTVHYFGMCQNSTEMVYTEHKLQVETEKALEAESLKSTFLKNMSHEIRTPLNAVLGFAELFNNPHAEEDEPIFAEEIKRNTGELLQLVNDILYLSRLDAKMEEMTIEECDFAALFEGYCYMGWTNISPNVKISVENPYNHLIIAIDAQHLGKVIQVLCEHAVLNTSEGSIRAKYEYRHGELSISIEDTGRGLSKEEQKRVFERFARSEVGGDYSTGLDMPIIKELIEQMGGSIELQSELGKGCTVYVIIPCKMTNMEKKTEITI